MANGFQIFFGVLSFIIMLGIGATIKKYRNY